MAALPETVTLCECGCGQPSGVYASGKRKGEPRRFRHGHNNPRKGCGRPLEERFHEKYVKDAATGCWVWQGKPSNVGYGTILLPGSRVPQGAHRVSLMLAGRDIPPRHHVHHACHNKLCVNPEHLEVLSPTAHHAEHMPRLEMCTKGLHPMNGTNLKQYWSATRQQWNRYCHACRMEYQRQRRAGVR